MFHTSLICLIIIETIANLASGNPIARRPTDTSIQHLTLDFKSRGSAGKIHVTVQPNNDNKTAFGFSVLSPTVPLSELSAEFGGFPVVHGPITYPIPANPTSGYGSLFGWIQFIQNNTGADWAVDSYPYAQDLGDPFGGWGYLPTHFDAPAIPLATDGDNTPVVWRAMTYLCELADAGVTKNVTVLSGGAFTWGFDLDVNAANTSARSIVVTKVEVLDVETEWKDRLALLRGQYTEWTFNDV